MDFRWKRSSNRAFYDCWHQSICCRYFGAQPLLSAELYFFYTLLQFYKFCRNDNLVLPQKNVIPTILETPKERCLDMIFCSLQCSCIPAVHNRQEACTRQAPAFFRAGLGYLHQGREMLSRWAVAWLAWMHKHSLPFWPHPANSSPTERPTEQLLHNFSMGARTRTTSLFMHSWNIVGLCSAFLACSYTQVKSKFSPTSGRERKNHQNWQTLHYTCNDLAFQNKN